MYEPINLTLGQANAIIEAALAAARARRTRRSARPA